jgi:peptidyl-prolyl cis-trans isomerase D
MLQEIRDRAQGWIAYAIIALISIPFALWGIQEYLGVGRDPVVATVNGQQIMERELDNAFHGQQRRSGELGEVATALDRRQVLDAMIREALLVQAAEGMKLRASDASVVAAIHALPAFQRGGRFDQAAFQSELRRQGLSEGGFEQQIRRLLVTNQLIDGLRGSAIVTNAQLDDALRLSEQKRDVSYFVVRANAEDGALAVSDEEIRARYESGVNQYLTPERVQVEYLELDAHQLAASITPDEETLRAFFEQRRGELAEPAQRKARHILVKVDMDAAEDAVAAAKAKATAALERIRNGADFAVVAREVSDDRGSAEQGGDLGWFERGVMVKEFEDAAFSQPPGGVGGLVRSPFGFHLIEVTEARDPGPTSFEYARETLLAAFRQAEAERLYYEQIERLADLTYENSGSLEPAAQSLGLSSQVSEWFGREGGAGLLASPKVVAAAFSEEVRAEGRNSDPIEVGPEHAIVLRVRGYEESRPRPLADVREEIRAEMLRERAAAVARTRGEDLLRQAKGGSALDSLAQAAGATLEKAGKIGRRGAAVPAQVVGTAFGLPRDAAGKPVFGLASLAEGDVAVVAVLGVEDGNPAVDAAQREVLREALAAQTGALELSRFSDLLHARATIEVKPAAAASGRDVE